ncbi:thymidylate synthase [Curtobacterium luteum]|uniref:thymidylate synthase n=1 Tax=Curtobacterium luteum TaxID=33881 RepID=UPI003806FA33
MTPDSNLPADASEARRQIIRDVLDDGVHVEDDSDRGSFRELQGYTTGMANPLARVRVGADPLNTVGAIARFVWMVSGSDRLEDIAFYEKQVRPYTDDELSVPGSSYGKRLFNAKPGLNQMAGVIKELQKNPSSRRAAAVVWIPEDAVRESNDIPCTFGLFFHIRGGELIMTTVMRSNNAFTLVPYNFFEFTMLGEIVAADVGVPFGRYMHWAASMHVFDSQAAPATTTASRTDSPAVEMPPMPAGDALEQATALARFEAKLRNASTLDELHTVASDARSRLGGYWGPLFDVLYAFVLAKREHFDEANSVIASLPSYLKPGAEKYVGRLITDEPLPASSTDGALFDADVLEKLNGFGAAATLQATAGGDFELIVECLHQLSTPDDPVTLEELLAVREILVQADVTLAARNAGSAVELTPEVIAATLDTVRREARP